MLEYDHRRGHTGISEVLEELEVYSDPIYRRCCWLWK